MKSYYDLNIEFYDALNQIFKINKKRNWNDLKSEINYANISETYKIYGKIFNQNLDRYSILPKANVNQKSVSLFYGFLNGRSILNNIARYSIYCDEIIVFHPMQNPVNTAIKYNPIKKPEIWKNDFVNALYFYIVIQKWVREGIVHLIENPFNFDPIAQRELLNAQEKWLNENLSFIYDNEVKKEQESMFLENLKISFAGWSEETLRKVLRPHYPNYSESKLKELALKVRDYSKENPLYVDLGSTNSEALLVNRSGANLEMVNAICRLTGAYPYTTQKTIKKQLEIRGQNTYWTKFSEVFSGIELAYLDGVDTSFALEVRKENRISGVRKVLRDIGAFIEETRLEELRDEKLLDFNDRLRYEINRSEEEWKEIKRDASKRKWLSFATSNVASLLIDPTKIILPSLVVPSSFAIVEYFKKQEIKSYRSRDPMSVFVDLKNREPSFFSDLKNCIF